MPSNIEASIHLPQTSWSHTLDRTTVSYTSTLYTSKLFEMILLILYHYLVPIARVEVVSADPVTTMKHAWFSHTQFGKQFRQVCKPALMVVFEITRLLPPNSRSSFQSSLAMSEESSKFRCRVRNLGTSTSRVPTTGLSVRVTTSTSLLQAYGVLWHSREFPALAA